jgi:thiol-disulfide isomerase/thioredoxin
MIGIGNIRIRKARIIYRAGFGIGLAAMIFTFLLLKYPPSASNHNQAPKFRGEMSKIVLLQELSPAPLTTFLDSDEIAIDLSRFRGKVVLLNFWATWCYPCLLEMPSLNSLQAELGGKQFIVVALSIDRGGLAEVKRYFRKHELGELSLYRDPLGTVGRAFRLIGVPASYIIDHNGIVRGYFPGPADWNSSNARAVIRHFVAQVANDKEAVNATGATNQPE